MNLHNYATFMYHMTLLYTCVCVCVYVRVCVLVCLCMCVHVQRRLSIYQLEISKL